MKSRKNSGGNTGRGAGSSSLTAPITSVIWKLCVGLALGMSVMEKANNQCFMCPAGTGNEVVGILPGKEDKSDV